MILNHEKNTNPLLYEAKVGCMNCDSVEVLGIKKGKQVDDWIKTEKVKCTNCQCLETLQSWKQYLAGRAMITQILKMSEKEEDVEGKGRFGHFG